MPSRRVRPTLDPHARRLLSVPAIVTKLADRRTLIADRASLTHELRGRVWALRYAMRLRSHRIEALEASIVEMRSAQSVALAEQSSLFALLLFWAPDLAAEEETSTGAWLR